MKLSHLLFGLLAGVAFVACTNDDDPAGVTPVNGGDEVAATKYMAINFVMPGDATTRAWDDTFEAATGDEIAMADAQILFFDGEGQVADPYTALSDEWSNGSGSIDKQHAAVIVLKNAIKDPTSVVAILNAPKDQQGNALVTRSTTMTQLKEMTADFRKNPAANLTMINSVYVNGSDVQFAVPVTSDNIKDSESAALGVPVKIAVEKVVAKVTLANESGDTDTDQTSNAGKKISVAVNGWWLDSTNPQSYLVKSLDASYTAFGDWGKWTWNDPTNFRSYWANSLAMTAPEHFKLADAVQLANPIYAHENTDQTKKTELVVAATLTVEGNTSEDKSLIKFMSDVYTVDDFETQLYGTISTQYYTRSGDEETGYTYTSVTKDAFTFNYTTGGDLKDYEALVTMTYNNAETAPLYAYKGTTPVTFTSPSVKVQYWNNGKTYYHIPIIHNSDIVVNEKTAATEAEDGTEIPATYWGLFGIVRNHLYKVNITGISGLGTPVADTNQVIIPVTPPEDKETYLAADIVILKYKVVEQDVNLGE